MRVGLCGLGLEFIFQDFGVKSPVLGFGVYLHYGGEHGVHLRLFQVLVLHLLADVTQRLQRGLGV